jgi:parallel beta-helix repeat protein
MKKILTLLIVLTAFYARAQYSTPGTGVTWGLSELVQNSAGTVILNGDHYEITATLTILPADAIEIMGNVTVLFHDLAGIESEGTLIIDAPDQSVFRAIDSTSSNKWRGFKLLADHVTHIRNTTFSFGGGIRVQAGTFSIEGSTLYKNYYKSGSGDGSYASSAALDLSGNANVLNCSFLFNQRGAIASGSNIPCRANIRNNYIFGNTVENTNRPQINMGPSGENDTTFIVGNTVIGNGSTNAGGIAYSSLVGVAGNVVIDSNLIDLNRYGITLTGSPINGAIRYNTVTNNNIQNEPNLGGSGLNFTASSASSELFATVTGNIISGNLWGITIIGYPQVNMGDSATATFNPGGNQFNNNGNGGSLYDLYNNGQIDQPAMYNCWGVPTQNAASIETVIFHEVDDPTLGRVNFMPSCAFQTIFTVQNESGTLLQGVEIAIAGEDASLFTDANGEVMAMLSPGNHTFTATLADYSDYNSSITVVPGVNYVEITMTQGTFELLFNVFDEDMLPVEDAEIAVASELLITGAEGTASILLANGNYPYTITKEGYLPAEGIAVIDGANAQVDVELVASTVLYTVTFIVDSNMGIVSGAEIQINGETLFTNDDGMASIQLPDGEYQFMATAIDYSAVEGTVVVDGADVEVPIFLQTGIQNPLSAALKSYPNPVIDRLYLDGAKIDAAEVYSITGKLLLRFDEVNGFLDLRDLEQGMYLIRVKSQGLETSLRVVKK